MHGQPPHANPCRGALRDRCSRGDAAGLMCDKSWLWRASPARSFLGGPGGPIAVQAFALLITLPRVSNKCFNSSEDPVQYRDRLTSPYLHLLLSCLLLASPEPFLPRRWGSPSPAASKSLYCQVSDFSISTVSSPTPSCQLAYVLSLPNPQNTIFHSVGPSGPALTFLSLNSIAFSERIHCSSAPTPFLSATLPS